MADSLRAFEDAWKSRDYLHAIEALVQLRREDKELMFTFHPPNDATLRSMSGISPRVSMTDVSSASIRSSLNEASPISPWRSSVSSGQSGFLAKAEQSRAK